MSKLLHIIDTGGPGGAETVFMQLASGLRVQGLPGVTMISREGWLAEQLRERGFDPVISPPTASRLAYLRRIARTVQQEQVSLIVVHLLGASFYASLAGALTKIPVISVLHGQKDLETSRMNWLKGRALSLPRGRTVFVSAALRDEVQPMLGLTDRRCTVIHNGVDTTAFEGVSSTLRDRLSISPDALLVGAVGNIRTPKAYDIMLRAAAQAVRRDSRIVFLVAGEGRPPLSQELAALHNELKLGDRFRFLGLVDDVPEFLGGLDMFMLASRKEGFSIACVEAMAAGLPVIATRSGGPEAIVEDGISGYLVPPGNADALASAVASLTGDIDLRRRLGAAGKARAKERFSIGTCVDAYQRLISEMIDE